MSADGIEESFGGMDEREGCMGDVVGMMLHKSDSQKIVS